MSGDTKTFDKALKQAHSAAWDRDWRTAVREYRRALEEDPKDTVAHTGLAGSLEESGDIKGALLEWSALFNNRPDDLMALTHMAALLEKLGHRRDAVANYLRLAEAYIGLKQPAKAIRAWQRVIAVDPDRLDTYDKVISAFLASGQSKAAVKTLIGLAQAYQRQKNIPMAKVSLEKALAIEPGQPEAQTLIAEYAGRSQFSAAPTGDGPVERSRRSSLSRLAQTLLDEPPKWESEGTDKKGAGPDVEPMIARALDAQNNGRVSEAIKAYQDLLDAGVTRPEVQFNLALLYQSAFCYDDAISLFEKTARKPDYALASYLALGQCLRAQGQSDAALAKFVEAVKIVDMSTVPRSQADDVIKLYEGLAENLRGKGAEARAEEFIASLTDLLNQRGWEDKVVEVRGHLQSMAQAGADVNLADVLEMEDSWRVIDSLRLSESYMKQNQFTAASEEAYTAIGLAPDYLPSHVRLAEICERAGRTQDARDKYEALAETSAAREDIPHAISFFRRALALDPDDLNPRSRIIELLVRNGELPKGLEEYLELGLALQRAGQFSEATNKYMEAIDLAKRAGATSPAVGDLRKRLAECYFRARNWEQTLPLYQQILEQAPDDDEARLCLAELYLQLGQRDQSEKELERLLARRGNAPEASIAILTTLVRRYPDDLPLNIRLARAHIAAREMDKGIGLLDELGERLLNNGKRNDAVQIIREIISLDPPQQADYQKLLEQLTQ